MLICHPEAKKQSTEWLRALKKVCLRLFFVNSFFTNFSGNDTIERVILNINTNKIVYACLYCKHYK